LTPFHVPQEAGDGLVGVRRARAHGDGDGLGKHGVEIELFLVVAERDDRPLRFQARRHGLAAAARIEQPSLRGVSRQFNVKQTGRSCCASSPAQ
jgi:hypothetical protein